MPRNSKNNSHTETNKFTWFGKCPTSTAAEKHYFKYGELQMVFTQLSYTQMLYLTYYANFSPHNWLSCAACFSHSWRTFCCTITALFIVQDWGKDGSYLLFLSTILITWLAAISDFNMQLPSQHITATFGAEFFDTACMAAWWFPHVSRFRHFLYFCGSYFVIIDNNECIKSLDLLLRGWHVAKTRLVCAQRRHASRGAELH